MESRMTATSPLCFGQLSIWRSIETNPLVDGIRSQLTELRPLPAGVSEQRVRAAVEALWRRHEGLRTTFECDGSAVRQIVHPSPDDVLVVRSLHSSADLRPCADELFARPFRLTKEFGWQVRLLRVADGTLALALSVHHILADRWALRLLLAEFDRLLADPGALGSPAPAPAALAHRQRSDEWAARRAAARRHWIRLTEDFADPPGEPAAPPGDRIRGSLDLGHLGRAGADLVDRYRVTAQTVLLTLFALGIRAITGRQRLLVHLMVANRLRPEWHDLVTSMNQIVPAGIVVDEADGAADLLRLVQAAGLAGMRNGCHDVDEAAAITRRPPGSPVDHVLNYMLPDWPARFVPHDQRHVSVTIEPSTRPAIAGIYGVVRESGTPVLELHADANRYPAGRLRAFLGGTEKALRLLSARSDLRVADLIALY